MKSPIVNKSPRTWLTEVAPKRNPDHVLATYAKTPPPQVYIYRAPHRLFRVRGSKSGGPVFSGLGWWADERALARVYGRLEQFEGWLTPAERDRLAPGYYRELAAISHNWSDFAEVYTIELQGGEMLEGLAGIAKDQPAWAAEGGAPPSASQLQGGAEQVYLNVTNPFLVKPVRIW